MKKRKRDITTLVILGIISPMILFAEVFAVSEFTSNLSAKDDMSVFLGVVEICAYLGINVLLFILIKSKIKNL